MTASYVLTLAAEADLRDVIRYTRKQWGDAQTRSYVAKLRAGMESVATGDPSDEPATTLLERIRAERAAAPKAKRGRRKAA